MAVTATVYNSAKKKLIDGSIDIDTDTIKVALCTSSYTPNIDTHVFFSDISSEVSSAGYSAGGVALANKSVTVDTTNDLAYFDADDTTWTGVTFTYRYAIIYKSTGTSSTSPLIYYVDFGTDRTNSADTAYLQWSASGLLKLT